MQNHPEVKFGKTGFDASTHQGRTKECFLVYFDLSWSNRWEEFDQTFLLSAIGASKSLQFPSVSGTITNKNILMNLYLNNQRTVLQCYRCDDFAHFYFVKTPLSDHLLPAKRYYIIIARKRLRGIDFRETMKIFKIPTNRTK